MRWIIFSLMVISSAHGAELVVGRYSRIVADAPQAPLSAPVLNAFVAAKSVGDAVRLVLAGTGYSTATGRFTHPMQSELFTLPLPAVHRDLSAMTAQDALVTLGGPAYRVMVDHVHRQIGFELRPRFRGYANHSAASSWSCVALAGKFQCVAAS
jgi:conjugative transfer region protein (TIGR03748 family)